MLAVAAESLSNNALVQAYDQHDAESKRFHDENLGGFRAEMTATRHSAAFTPLVTLLETAGVLLVIGFGVWELVAGSITLGGLLVFVTYLSQLYAPVRGVAELYNSIFAASASAERVLELLDEQSLVKDPANPKPIGRANGAVTVEGLSFSYPGFERPSLTDVSFSGAPGQQVAIVGASGAGKSTLAKLLIRSYDPDHGRVTLDGIDVRDLALSDLRRNLAVVLQDTLAFHGTIRENIRFGKRHADVREIVRAAVAADADEFITALPDGYDTMIGHRGRTIAGGQMQRLAIARAMIRDAPVLLLYEPTTGTSSAPPLDQANERHFRAIGPYGSAIRPCSPGRAVNEPGSGIRPRATPPAPPTRRTRGPRPAPIRHQAAGTAPVRPSRSTERRASRRARPRTRSRSPHRRSPGHQPSTGGEPQRVPEHPGRVGLQHRVEQQAERRVIRVVAPGEREDPPDRAQPGEHQPHQRRGPRRSRRRRPGGRPAGRPQSKHYGARHQHGHRGRRGERREERGDQRVSDAHGVPAVGPAQRDQAARTPR